MAGRQKHKVRSQYSYRDKVDFSGFTRQALIKTEKQVNRSMIETFLGLFKRQKVGK